MKERQDKMQMQSELDAIVYYLTLFIHIWKEKERKNKPKQLNLLHMVKIIILRTIHLRIDPIKLSNYPREQQPATTRHRNLTRFNRPPSPPDSRGIQCCRRIIARSIAIGRTCRRITSRPEPVTNRRRWGMIWRSIPLPLTANFNPINNNHLWCYLGDGKPKKKKNP